MNCPHCRKPIRLDAEKIREVIVDFISHNGFITDSFVMDLTKKIAKAEIGKKK